VRPGSRSEPGTQQALENVCTRAEMKAIETTVTGQRTQPAKMLPPVPEIARGSGRLRGLPPRANEPPHSRHPPRADDTR
jgi:hypothetical protein